jgi:hypothetical protein
MTGNYATPSAPIIGNSAAASSSLNAYCIAAQPYFYQANAFQHLYPAMMPRYGFFPASEQPNVMNELTGKLCMD